MFDGFGAKKSRPDEPFGMDKADAVLKQEAYDDCLSCRVVGSTALVATGGYVYVTGMKTLRERRTMIERSRSRYRYGSRQLGIFAISATLVGMGLYRTFS